MSTPMISPNELQARLQAGQPAEVIDVRTAAEYTAVHAAPARHVPLDTLDAQAFARRAAGAPPVYVLCQGGGRARTACERMLAAGAENIAVVEGGTRAWEAAGLPVVRGGKRVMSLERQVRATVGAGVLCGTILALTVNPLWVLLCGFFGAGLLFAGLTDWCGLGLLLARMPWNRG